LRFTFETLSISLICLAYCNVLFHSTCYKFCAFFSCLSSPLICNHCRLSFLSVFVSSVSIKFLWFYTSVLLPQGLALEVKLFIQGVSKLCAISDRGATGRHYESERPNEHRSGNTSVKRYRG
jgi:hypothetical protein